MAVSNGIITNVGKKILADLTGNTSATKWPLYIAWGTGNETVSATLTKLGQERQRAKATVVDTTARINLSKTFTASVPSLKVYTAREVGVFDAASGGNLLYYGKHGASCVQALIDGDTYTIKIRLDLEQTGAEFTATGFNMLADLFTDEDSPTAFTYMAYGTGTTAESTALTALTTETDRVAATVTLETTTTVDDTIRFNAMFDTASAVTISEIGIFNASSSGTMAWRRLLDSADRRTTTTGGRENIIVDFVYTDGGFSGTPDTCGTL